MQQRVHDYVLTHVAFGLNPPLQEVVDRSRHFDFDGDGVITFDEYLATIAGISSLKM